MLQNKLGLHHVSLPCLTNVRTKDFPARMTSPFSVQWGLQSKVYPEKSVLVRVAEASRNPGHFPLCSLLCPLPAQITEDRKKECNK